MAKSTMHQAKAMATHSRSWRPAGFHQIPLGMSCHWKGYPYPSLCPNFAGVVSTPDFAVGYRTNSRGLRDREYPLEKPAGKTRILALGDSFTFGHGIAYGERFTDILESEEEHIDWLQTQLRLIEQMGIENFVQLQSKPNATAGS